MPLDRRGIPHEARRSSNTDGRRAHSLTNEIKISLCIHR